jgi:hypothetical protein
MTSVSGSSSSSAAAALQAQQLLQQLLKQEQQSQPASSANSTGSANSAASLFASQVATASGTPQASSSSGNNVDLSQLFSALDTNGDGSISKDEFNTAIQNMDSGTKSALLNAQEQQSATNNVFSQADTNGDGSISKSEFDSMAKSVHHGHGGGHHSKAAATDDTTTDPTTISSVFSPLDTDGDGGDSIANLMTTVQQDSSNIAAQGAKSAAEQAGVIPVNTGSANAQVSQNTASLMKMLSAQMAASQQQPQAVFQTTA